MIVFFAPGGRLGNVMFKLSYIEQIRRRNEWVFTVQLRGSTKLFRGLRRYVEFNSWLARNLVDFVLRPLFVHGLCRFRLVSSIRERDGVIRSTSGLFPVTFLEGYFQDPRCASADLKLKVDPSRWRLLFAEAGSRVPVFVHVRRTDYVGWTVLGSVSPLLPAEYYHRALADYFADRERYHFFLLGDSPEWSDVQFGSLPHRTVSRLTPLEDLALMAACAGGVVSNSTFAWWGARLCSRAEAVVGPRWWLGWRAATWYPSTIETPWMRYLELDRSLP